MRMILITHGNYVSRKTAVRAVLSLFQIEQGNTGTQSVGVAPYIARPVLCTTLNPARPLFDYTHIVIAHPT